MNHFYGAADTKINRKLRLLAACRKALAEYGILMATIALLLLIGLIK
jgi:hypothetical protein